MDGEIKNIFLSASIPSVDRSKEYYETVDVVAVRDAVIALASIVLPHCRLIWGGHPSITPLIVAVLKNYGLIVNNHITLYQSDYFVNDFPEENKDIPHYVCVPSIDNDKDASLALMRERMINDNDFYAAFFIGGMEGVEREYAMFCAAHPDAKVFPLATTGAASRKIFCTDKFNPRLGEDMAYMSLFYDLLEEILI